VCLGVPFALTFSSLVCLLIVSTGLVTNKSYFFARFETAHLEVSASTVASTLSSRTTPLEARTNVGIAHLTSEALATTASSAASTALSGTNITASDLGLADSHTVGLWSYCSQKNNTNGTVTQKCSKPKAEFWFDPFSIWNLNDTTAETAINSTTLTDALKTYKTAAKWTWVFYLVAFIFTVVELLFGVVAIFSKLGSCCTTIASNISSVAIVLASILATVMWSILVESFNHELKKYGLTATVSTKMLAVTWLAAAFSIASGFFWMISICCCGSTDRHYSTPKRARGQDDAEKLVPRNGPYEQIGGNFAPTSYVPPTQQGYAPQEFPQQAHQMSGAKDTAYEPYRHNNI